MCRGFQLSCRPIRLTHVKTPTSCTRLSKDSVQIRIPLSTFCVTERAPSVYKLLPVTSLLSARYAIWQRLKGSNKNVLKCVRVWLNGWLENCKAIWKGWWWPWRRQCLNIWPASCITAWPVLEHGKRFWLKFSARPLISRFKISRGHIKHVSTL